MKNKKIFFPENTKPQEALTAKEIKDFCYDQKGCASSDEDFCPFHIKGVCILEKAPCVWDLEYITETIRKSNGQL